MNMPESEKLFTHTGPYITINASVAPIKNLVVNNIILIDVKEKIKQDKLFNNNINEQTLLGLNLENIHPTKRLAKDNPK